MFLTHRLSLFSGQEPDFYCIICTNLEIYEFTYLLTYLLNYLIIRIRRTIGHLTTIISCNKTGIFTNHQKKLKEKYKKHGNTKLHTLNFKLTVLKHNRHATSVRLMYQKKRFNQKFINQKFSTLARTSLPPKNTETELAENYRPIACLNFMYKIYIGCLNSFLYDHCHCHKIITTEQAAGKKGVWGCTEQLLINKSIMSEVRSKKRNLLTIWLNYKKAFDFVPHEWLIKSLHLAKLPEDLIRAIENLASQWYTVLHLKGEEEVIV